MHKLLERQLCKHYGSSPPQEPQFSRFVAAIDAAYGESDAAHALLERAIELSSQELVERNTQLRAELASIQRLELELRQAEKLRAVGQLAAGVAHEINTPIQYVGDSIHFTKDALLGLVALVQRLHAANSADPSALEQLQASAGELDLTFLLDEVPKALEQASDGLQRVASIVAAMKEFGRPDSRSKTLTDLNRCLENTMLVAHSELKHVADVELSLQGLPMVPCFPGELNQVLLTLLVNAAHAVAQRHTDPKQRGLIRISTALNGDRAVIAIADNGVGIAPEHQARIFEPFFTTKPVGTGTGQGLAIARSIVVEKHGGSLYFDSTPGQGTTFVMSIPL